MVLETFDQSLAPVMISKTADFQVCYWSIGKQTLILKLPSVDSAAKSGMDESDCSVDASLLVGFLETNNILTLLATASIKPWEFGVNNRCLQRDPEIFCILSPAPIQLAVFLICRGILCPACTQEPPLGQ